MAESIAFAICVRGYHVYQEIWTPAEGETLICSKETRNREDSFAVAVLRNGEVVGHIPRSLLCACSFFLWRGGSMACRITGKRQHSSDLPQGGLEILCIYVLSGPSWKKQSSACPNCNFTCIQGQRVLLVTLMPSCRQSFRVILMWLPRCRQSDTQTDIDEDAMGPDRVKHPQ